MKKVIPGPQVFINNKGIQREYMEPTGEPEVQFRKGHGVTLEVPNKKPFAGDVTVLETGTTYAVPTAQKP